MAGSSQPRVYVYKPQPPAGASGAARPAATPVAGLAALGCLGLLLGMLLVACVLGALVLPGARAGLPPTAAPDASRPDIVITVQEAYFQHLVSSALPPDWAEGISLELQPGGLVVFKGKIKANFFGVAVAGDYSATSELSARDGHLVIKIRPVEVMGISLAGFVDKFTNELSARITEMVDKQVQDGLGANAYIMDVRTDDHQLVILARLP